MLFKFYTEKPDILGKAFRKSLLIVARKPISLPAILIFLQSVYPILCLYMCSPFCHIRMNFSTFSDETAALAVRQCRFQNQLKINSAKIISFACCLIQFINCVHFIGLIAFNCSIISCFCFICSTIRKKRFCACLSISTRYSLRFPLVSKLM